MKDLGPVERILAQLPAWATPGGQSVGPPEGENLNQDGPTQARQGYAERSRLKTNKTSNHSYCTGTDAQSIELV